MSFSLEICLLLVQNAKNRCTKASIVMLMDYFKCNTARNVDLGKKFRWRNSYLSKLFDFIHYCKNSINLFCNC